MADVPFTPAGQFVDMLKKHNTEDISFRIVLYDDSDHDDSIDLTFDDFISVLQHHKNFSTILNYLSNSESVSRDDFTRATNFSSYALAAVHGFSAVLILWYQNNSNDPDFDVCIVDKAQNNLDSAFFTINEFLLFLDNANVIFEYYVDLGKIAN